MSITTFPLKYFFFCWLIVSCASAWAQTENLYDRTHTLRYGAHLLHAGEYDLAIQEYERLVFMDSTDEVSRLSLLRAYRLSGKYQQAETRFRSLYSTTDALTAAAAGEYAKVLLQSNSILRAKQFLTSAPVPDSLRPILQTSLALLSADWQTAQRELAAVPDTALAWHRSFRALATDGTGLRYKSPALAATFSALVPGSGKAYVGVWKDGIFSLVMIGLTSWQSYRAFHKNGNRSIYGWSYAGLATGLYLGNIWGSAKAARVHNHRLKETILTRVRYEINHFL